MQCILCEKPSAAKNYATALGGFKGTFNGKQYQIVNSVGHIFSMLTPEKQVESSLVDKYTKWDIQNLPWSYKDLKFEKELKGTTKDVFKKIKDVASQCDEFVIATDDDPTGEGTLLAVEIIEALKLKGVRYYRSFHVDESPKEIQKAMRNLKDLGFDPKTDPDFIKSDFRNKWDFMSMQWTRIFTKLGDGYSVLRQGRLKSYMVWAVGEQIKQAEGYKKIPFYENKFQDENGNLYSSKKEKQYEKKEDVPKGNYHDSDVVLDGEEKKYTAPPALYDLNMLSATLAPKGYSSKQVLDTYQSMYEKHIVSYPRTEDKTITPEQFNEFLAIADKVAKVVGVDTKLLTHRSPRKTHVVEAGSHGANRPSSNVPTSLDAIEKEYGKCGSMIYQFLARNSLAMLCEDYEYIHQTGHIKDFPDFVGASNIPSKLGYKEIFNDEKNQTEEKKLGNKAKPIIHEGFPPKPAWPTAKWLAKLLKKNDVGTGATRASIYAEVTNQKAKYPLLIDIKGKITMTEYGNMSYKLLPNTHIGDVKLTENLQAQMREVAKGSAPEKYLEEIEKLILEDIKTVEENSKNLVGSITNTISCNCPKCGMPLKKRSFGYTCSEYDKDNPNSKCDFFVCYKTYGGVITDKDIESLIIDGETKEPVKLKSKEGKAYSAKLKMENGKISPIFSQAKQIPYTCPKCGEALQISNLGIKCSSKEKNCDFIMFRKIAKKELTDTQLLTLLSARRVGPINGFVSKNGKSFSAILLLKENKVEFEFTKKRA